MPEEDGRRPGRGRVQGLLYEITWSGAIGESYTFDDKGEVVGLSNVVVEVLPMSERTEENQGYKVLGGAPIE